MTVLRAADVGPRQAEVGPTPPDRDRTTTSPRTTPAAASAPRIHGQAGDDSWEAPVGAAASSLAAVDALVAGSPASSGASVVGGAAGRPLTDSVAVAVVADASVIVGVGPRAGARSAGTGTPLGGRVAVGPGAVSGDADGGQEPRINGAELAPGGYCGFTNDTEWVSEPLKPEGRWIVPTALAPAGTGFGLMATVPPPTPETLTESTKGWPSRFWIWKTSVHEVSPEPQTAELPIGEVGSSSTDARTGAPLARARTTSANTLAPTIAVRRPTRLPSIDITGPRQWAVAAS
jgi:hypothetical protein